MEGVVGITYKKENSIRICHLFVPLLLVELWQALPFGYLQHFYSKASWASCIYTWGHCKRLSRHNYTACLYSSYNNFSETLYTGYGGKQELSCRDFFNLVAQKWDTMCQHDVSKIDKIVELVDLEQEDSVLDVGTGTGVMIPHLLKRVGVMWAYYRNRYCGENAENCRGQKYLGKCTFYTRGYYDN